MQLLSVLGIAVALAMDAFAVAVATGVNLKNVSYRQTFRLSWHFGLLVGTSPSTQTPSAVAPPHSEILRTPLVA